MIRGWLKAGVFEAGKGFAPTEEGTPQGGVISPCLLNVALHGLEEAAGVRYQTSGTHAGDARPGSPVAVRYADDVVVLCHSQEQAERSRRGWRSGWRPGAWPSTRTRRRSSASARASTSWGSTSAATNRKLLIKPSKAAVKRLRERLAAEMRTLRGGERGGGHRRAQPRHPGLGGLLPGQWCHPGVRLAGRLRVEAHLQVGQVAPHEQAEAWIVGRYFGKFNKFRNDRWVFGDRDSGAYLVKFSWTGIHGTCWSRARHPPMTPPWPATGPNGARRSSPRWTATPCACSPGRTGAARCAGTTCSSAEQPPQSPRAVGAVVAARHPQGDSRQLPHPPRAARPAGR